MKEQKRSKVVKVEDVMPSHEQLTNLTRDVAVSVATRFGVSIPPFEIETIAVRNADADDLDPVAVRTSLSFSDPRFSYPIRAASEGIGASAVIVRATVRSHVADLLRVYLEGVGKIKRSPKKLTKA